MKVSIAKGVFGYLVGFVLVSILGLIFGSFIAGELWNPYGTGERRAAFVSLALVFVAPLAMAKDHWIDKHIK